MTLLKSLIEKFLRPALLLLFLEQMLIVAIDVCCLHCETRHYVLTLTRWLLNTKREFASI